MKQTNTSNRGNRKPDIKTEGSVTLAIWTTDNWTDGAFDLQESRLIFFHLRVVYVEYALPSQLQ